MENHVEQWREIKKWHGRVLFIDVHSTPVFPAAERIVMMVHIVSVMLVVQYTFHITKTRKKGSNHCFPGNTSFAYFI